MLKASPVYADYLATLAKNHTLPVAGIVLGMTRSHRPDTIIHMCRLFKSEDDQEDGAATTEEDRKDTLVYDIQDILSMLTPGIEVLGTFVVSKSAAADDVVKDAAAWDRVKLIYRVIRKLCPNAQKHYLMIHDGGKATTTCKLVVGDKPNLDKNELKAATVEFSDKDAYKLVQVNAQFSLTRSHFLRSYDWVGSDRGRMKLAKVKEMLVGGLERTLKAALVTFNGEIPVAKQKISEVAVNQADASGGSGDRNKLAPVVAEIYEKNVPIGDDEEVKRSSDLLQLKGCVASRLFVYPDDTLEYVEELLRKDLIQTISQRIQRATEMGDAGEDQKNESIALDDLSDRLGRRIYFTIQPSNVQLFDYLFPEETEDELRERINHKLDVDVEVTDIYFDLEEDGQGLSTSGRNVIESLGGQSVTDGGGKQKNTIQSTATVDGNKRMMFLFMRFALVAIAAIFIPLLFGSKKEGGK